MSPHERVTERVWRHGDPNAASTPRPLLTLEEFFDGNMDAASLGCNLDETPAPDVWFARLAAMRARPEVADIRIQVTMFDDPDGWPFSDNVWFITAADSATVRSWFDEEIAPDDVSAGWTAGVVFEFIAISPGMQPVACWWD